MQRGGFRAPIDGDDANENVLNVGFGVLNKKIEITAFGEDSGIEQFEFRLAAAPAAVLFEEALVGKFVLRIFVQHAHVAVRGSRIEIEVALLHVFAVIALIPC